MRKVGKIIWFSLVFTFLSLILINPVLALEDYDQRVYKVDSSSYIQEGEDYQQNYFFKHYERRDRETYNDPYSCKYCERRENTYADRNRYTYYAYEDTRKSFWGDYVKEYSVYVTNRGRTGRYFTVVFELEDKNQYEFTQSVTQYLRTGEKKRFVYRDIQYEKNEILDWDYIIVPQKS